MNDNEWTAFIAISSLTIGWLLKEISQWLRGMGEDLKVKRRVLFHLLEVHHVFSKLDNSSFRKEFADVIVTKLPGQVDESIAAELVDQVFDKYIDKLADDTLSGKLENIEKSYSDSINDLAQSNPIIAYRLLGKNKIFEVFKMLNTYQENIQNDAKDIPDSEKILKHLMKTTRPQIISEAVDQLKKEIYSLSLSISPITRLKVVRILKQQKFSLSQENMSFFDKIIKQIPS